MLLKFNHPRARRRESARAAMRLFGGSVALRHALRWGSGHATLVICFVFGSGSFSAAEEPISFNRQIRPLLAEHCFTCHGPDAAQRTAELRLDTFDGATADLGGHAAIKPGDTATSALLARVKSADLDVRMPPREAVRGLTADEIILLERWIAQGARYERHWSFLPPERLPLPQVQQPGWVRNPIDHFIQARHDAAGLSPTPEADPRTLLRRLSLDLTGLPPSPEEMTAFLADTSPGRYDRAVDRLLASPRLGERLAAPWLDAARYADTNGYQSDGERDMWRWRDWVIEAFNANQPFDQFTIEQLAGDLLPGATFQQRLATGFNRNHRGNAEGGIIPEEYAVEYVVDRVETTSTVWLGLTIGCARCHDHKYDPVTQQEFYELYAFFNNVPERGKAIKFGNSPPLMPAPTREQQAQLAQAEAAVAAAKAAFAKLGPELAQGQRAWERQFGNTAAVKKPAAKLAPTASQNWTITEGLAARFDFEGEASETNTKHVLPGKLGLAASFNGQQPLDLGDVGNFGYLDRFTLAAWVHPAASTGMLLSRMTDTARSDGYGLRLEHGKLQVNLVKRWLDDAIRVETVNGLALNRWRHVLVTYDGSRTAAGIQVYFDGELQPLTVHLDDLNQSFENKEPFRLGGGGGDADRFQGLLDDVRIYDRALPPSEASIVAEAATIAELASQEPAERTTAGQRKLREYYLREAAPPAARATYAQLRQTQQDKTQLVETFPTVMVMEELPRPRNTFLLDRGQYDLPKQQVWAATPDCLPPLANHTAQPNNPTGGDQPDRLDLARWLVSPRHPLTARVTVNRLWQLMFGQGLVATPEDFGTQGAWPSHPELLDWLAVELEDSGWDLKHVLRLLVTSATYRQSSAASREGWAADPDNVLLARGARHRLSAEAIRDVALAAAGLLVERQGGPSVKPYQPAGLWKDVATISDYDQDHGADLYRRGLYTYFKRTVAPPGMAVFDAANRETCVVRTSRTNTPLQALTLLNSTAFVEAARVLAAHAMQTQTSVDGQLRYAFERILSRPPSNEELAVLRRGHAGHRARFANDLHASRQLVATGEFPAAEGVDLASHAALTALVSTLLNLDEAVTRQ